jgi:hypothetical protein
MAAGEHQEQEMRKALKLIRSPKRGVQDLVVSPLSFLAVVNSDGRCVAREIEPDPMKGMDMSQFTVVADALKGKAGYGIGEFKTESDKPSSVLLMAAPSLSHGRVVGAMVLGIPLWRLQQVLSKQLQMELASREQQVIIWVYVYRGADLQHHGTPPDLDKLVPDYSARTAGYAKSPGGFTGAVNQFAYWYGYGVQPLRVLGPDIGVVVFRMEP